MCKQKQIIMITLLYDFINQCQNLGVTPNESHIDAFLRKADGLRYREDFIRFCFYNWERRMEAVEFLIDTKRQ